MAALDPTAMGGFGKDQVAAMDPTAMGGFGKDQVAAMDPTAMGGFGKDQMRNMAPTAVGGFSKDQMAALDPTAMGGFGKDQVAAMDPTAMGGFSADQVSALDPTAIAGLNADKTTALAPAAFAGMSADQMSSITPGALSGLSVDQFDNLPADALGGLNSDNIGGLPPTVVAGLTAAAFDDLDPDEIKGMKDIASLITNLNPLTFTPDKVATVLGDGWAIDPSGDITAPPGAAINFKERPKAPPAAAGEAAVASQPDLTSSLALGAGSGGPSILDGMDNALAAAGAPGLDFKQSSQGILNIGDGTGGPPVASFIVDADNMTQAPEGAATGVSVDPKTGGYIIVTDKGHQIPLKPSISNPAEVAGLVGSDSKVVLGSAGQLTIEAPPSADGTVTAVAGIASPLLTTDERPAGTYTDGEGVNAVLKIVYADGTAQTLTPVIKDQDEFEAAAKEIPGVTDLILTDKGDVNLLFDGVKVKLKPLFKVVKGVPGAVVKPGISNKDGKFFFTSANGDTQEFASAPVDD
jgi:hypothetical protein